MPDQSGGPIHVDSGHLQDLANRLDGHLHQIHDIMSRYEAAYTHAQASQTFAGGAGAASVLTGGEIGQAQAKVSARFESANQMLRSGAHQYDANDADNKQAVMGLTSHLRLT